MTPQEGIFALGAISALASALNVYLTLRIRLEIAEVEKRILGQVHGEYCPREVCDQRMARLVDQIGDARA